ncbi:hypothetical protein ACIBO1_26990 [Micromonospora sp. NPDC049903]|uniref:hypothetical protein n=1 Tax=Micromonospora sp. NPDC049903 TaxID=3364276 RepID=UPI0037A1ED83
MTPTATAGPRQPVDPLTPAAIVAATTPEDRALLDACSKQAFRADDVQAAIHAHDQVAFATAYGTAMTTAISDVDDPAAVVRLAELHGDEAFGAGLTNLVWDNLALLLRSERQAVPASAVDSASVAAKAFLPGPRAGSVSGSAAAPVSPASTSTLPRSRPQPRPLSRHGRELH